MSLFLWGQRGQETPLPPDPVPVIPQLALESGPPHPLGTASQPSHGFASSEEGQVPRGTDCAPPPRERGCKQSAIWWGVPPRGFYRLVISVIAQTLVLHPWGENHVCP